MGCVALDGTKVKANASKHKAMSYGRMEEAERRLGEEVEALLRQAEEVDKAEDAQYGKGKRGDELPVELQRRETRLAVIRAAKAALERQAREKAEEEAAAAREKEEAETGQRAKGRKPKVPNPEEAKPEASAQRNFTDPESRIMPEAGGKSFVQGYNAQVVVDGEAQVIVAADVTQESNDKQQLVPMLEQVERNTGKRPAQGLADAGYFSEGAVTQKSLEGIDLYITPDRQKHSEEIPTATGGVPSEASSVIDRMRHKVRTEAGKAMYKRRKAIVEPVFGQIKEARGFRRFSFRGKNKVRAEWLLICLTHNLLKLFRAKSRTGCVAVQGA